MKKLLIIGIVCSILGFLLFLAAPVDLLGLDIRNTYAMIILKRVIGLGLFLTGIVLIAIFIKNKATAASHTRKETREAMEAGTVQKEGDDSLSARLVLLQIGRIVLFLLAIISAVIGLGFSMENEAILPIVIGVVIGLALFFLSGLCRAKVKYIIAKELIPHVLSDVFDDLTYRPEGCIPDEYICSNQLGLPDFNKIDGELCFRHLQGPSYRNERHPPDQGRDHLR